MATTRNRLEGNAGEDLAVDYLRQQGCTILQRNYRFERCEIDIIARDREELVFVEVKTRTSGAFGDPEDAVSDLKESHIRKVAEGYLWEHQLDDTPCRFDVVAVEMHNGNPVIRHLRDAF